MTKSKVTTKGASGFFAAGRKNESIVRSCSTGSSSTTASCFTNSACNEDSLPIRATGQLQWQDLSGRPYQQNVSTKRWGTVFFITPNLMMTAGHCFDIGYGLKPNDWKTPYDSKNYRFLSPVEFAPMMQLNMDYAYKNCSALPNDLPESRERSFPIKKLLEHRLGGFDYAIAEVDGSHPYMECDFNFTHGIIFIVQHPDGAPKKVETGNASTVKDGLTIKHNANTLGGSSGSALTFFKRACGVHVQGGDNYNEAVHMGAIFKTSPLLQAIYQLNSPTLLREPRDPKLSYNSGLYIMWGSLAAAGLVTAGVAEDKRIKTVAFLVLVMSVLGIIIGLMQEDKSKLEFNDDAGFGNTLTRC